MLLLLFAEGAWVVLSGDKPKADNAQGTSGDLAIAIRERPLGDKHDPN